MSNENLIQRMSVWFTPMADTITDEDEQDAFAEFERDLRSAIMDQAAEIELRDRDINGWVKDWQKEQARAEKAEAERDHYLRKVEQFAAPAPVASCAVNVTELAGMVNKELASMGLVLASAPAPVEDAVKAEIVAHHDAEAAKWEAELADRRSWGGPTIGAEECLVAIKFHKDAAIRARKPQ